MSRPGRQVIVDHFEPLQIVRYLFRLENLLLVTPFAIFWSFFAMSILAMGEAGATMAIVRGALGLFLSVALFFCYLLVVLDYTTRGYQQPPKISGDLISENKSKFFKAVLALSVFFSLSATLGGLDAGWFMVAISALVLPVVLAIIAIQDSFSRAMNPWNWLVFLTAIGWDRYFVYYLMCYSLLVAAFYFAVTATEVVIVVLAVFSITMLSLGLFRTIGILVHANADKLGLTVRFSHEVQTKQQQSRDQREESDFLAQLYRLSQADRSQEAFAAYQEYVRRQGEAAEGRLWPIISDWANPSLSLLAGQLYIEQLVAAENYRLAWQVLIKCFERNDDEFKLLTAKTTLSLCDRIETRNERSVAAELLRFFHQDFPNHPEAGAAQLKAADYLAELDRPQEARKLLQQLRIKYPDLARQPDYQRLARLVDVNRLGGQ